MHVVPNWVRVCLFPQRTIWRSSEKVPRSREGKIVMQKLFIFDFRWGILNCTLGLERCKKILIKEVDVRFGRFSARFAGVLRPLENPQESFIQWPSFKIWNVFLSLSSSALHGDSWGPVWFPHLLHAKDDTAVVRRIAATGGCFEVSSFLQKGCSLCHQRLSFASWQASEGQRKRQRLESG